MLSYEPGMLVRSLAGHDKGKLYIIIEERDQMLLLSDGKIRTMERPKTKKVMHGPADQRKAGREGNDGYFHPFIHKKISERTHVKGIQKGGTACQRLT